MKEKSDNKTIVVVGGVAGGMSFATRYRRLNQEDKIIIIDRNPYVSFANCGLPYHISGEIEAREDLIVVSKEILEKRFRLDVRNKQQVVSIDADKKEILVNDGEGQYQLRYDKLILSPGAEPVDLEIEGKESHESFHTLRNIPDLDQIMEDINKQNPKNALVIGGGFIGLEVAENLKNRGLEVSLIQRSDRVLPPFDPEMAVFANEALKENGINLILNDSINKIEEKRVLLNSGDELDADMIVSAVGVTPDTDFIEGSGIELGMKKGIKVDGNFKTSKDDIYAIGDAIIVKHTITNNDSLIALASPANRQGRQLADILSGIDHKNLTGSLGTSIVRIFDTAFASTGLNESQLEGYNYQAMHLVGKSNAGYFPGSDDIFLKVIFDKDSHEILGAQAIGKKGADKRIDVLATAIKAKMKIEDLQELELSYSPPYGTAKDLVNMVGYFAHNIILGLTNPIQIKELENLQNNGAIVIDVRTKNEYDQGHIKGAINISLDELRDKIDDLDKTKEYIVHCRSSVRSYNAERILKENGFKVGNLDGSWLYYSANYPDNIEG